ncbi:NFACT RNA binding domain-containing protein [Desulfohalobium retbaense]|uniref:NFACT RNA-binding domain-containing protein n=1 Tax=Desulfohalobium retbaense (strain ATCC 49708 / DSM 5692 / JCM 16813 / HR100) TaxID=485915 RepID=C8X3M2_DESRD|nr:NFACT RNA binding domain-containing protein [Desulfohalobium retbaense]ACV69019.1 protein of unknown function DUF814 [Desulfohalobium retbaense DSM 5692]
MEANFFRYLVPELHQKVQGQRVDKVYIPSATLWTIKFASHSHVLAVVDKKIGTLFWSPTRPPNPETPSGGAQWLRKRLRGRRLDSYVLDWPHRRVAWWVVPDGYWLMWDVCAGPTCLEALPDGFGASPAWPDSVEHAMDSQSWRHFPQLSPPLRSTLNSLSPDEAAAVLDRLATGVPDRFYCYYYPDGRAVALPWRLPEPLRTSVREVEADSAVEAARLEGEAALHSRLGAQRQGNREHKRARKKLERQLRHVHEDEHRLQEMIALAEDARFLQINLHRVDKDAKLDHVEGYDENGTWRRLALDPALNVQENMQRLFTKSRKGRRGIPHVRQRKEMLEQEYAALLHRSGEMDQQDRDDKQPSTTTVKRSVPRIPSRFQGVAAHAFRSSDGFLVLRGKNKKANHALLTKAARPFDLWLHTQGGPGAHVILVRDHQGQEVPQRSLDEAACLAALASHASQADKAEVMVALVRNVRPVKGAAPGQVRVDVVQQTLLVTVDAALEQQLRLDVPGAGTSSFAK